MERCNTSLGPAQIFTLTYGDLHSHNLANDQITKCEQPFTYIYIQNTQKQKKVFQHTADTHQNSFCFKLLSRAFPEK